MVKFSLGTQKSRGMMTRVGRRVCARAKGALTWKGAGRTQTRSSTVDRAAQGAARIVRTRRVVECASSRGRGGRHGLGRASSVGYDRDVVQPDIGAGEGDRRTHSGQRGMAIDCLKRGKAGERDGLLKRSRAPESEPLSLSLSCCSGGRRGGLFFFLSCGRIDLQLFELNDKTGD